MNKLLYLVTLAVVAFLSGCYETETQVLEKGEKTAMTGKYQCDNRISGESKTHTFSEKRDGIWPFASYQYLDDDGATSLFRKAPSGLFIGQTKSKKSKFSYAFIDFIDDKTFLILSVDLINKEDYIQPLLKKFGVEAKRTGDMTLLLKGDKGKIADFLAAHEKTLLTVVMKCVRTTK